MRPELDNWTYKKIFAFLKRNPTKEEQREQWPKEAEELAVPTTRLEVE